MDGSIEKFEMYDILTDSVPFDRYASSEQRSSSSIYSTKKNVQLTRSLNSARISYPIQTFYHCIDLTSITFTPALAYIAFHR